MDKNEKIKLKVEELLHKRNNLVAIVVVMISGIIGLIYNINNFISVVLLFIGIPCLIMFTRGLLNIEEQIRRLINDL